MLNKIMLIGRVGKDPEVRHFSNNQMVTSVTLATSEVFYDQKTKEKKEVTEWHRLSFFGSQAKVVSDWVKKGALIYVDGKIRTREYTDKSGSKRYNTEVIVDTLKLLGGKSDGSNKATQQPQQQPPSSVPNLSEDIPF